MKPMDYSRGEASVTQIIDAAVMQKIAAKDFTPAAIANGVVEVGTAQTSYINGSRAAHAALAAEATMLTGATHAAVRDTMPKSIVEATLKLGRDLLANADAANAAVAKRAIAPDVRQVFEIAPDKPALKQAFRTPTLKL